MSEVLELPLVDKAKAALERHSWREAFDLLSEADAGGSLSPDELELLAQASWWVGRLSDAIEARERAYAGYVSAGQPTRAAATATLLGRDNLLKNAHPVAAAWLNRADRLLEGAEESPVHGWLAATRAVQAHLAGDLDQAAAQSSRALENAARFGDRSLGAVALSHQGLNLILQGQVEQGLALVDEATVAAVGGEIDAFSAGGVTCTAISACTAIGDWARAAQWTDAQDRWCQREHINGFPGICRVHRAEIKELRGAWLEAEAEARRATEELQGFIPAAAGVALYEIGLIRLRRGDLPAAEEALLRAHASGQDAEPGLSLLRLAQGRLPEASASIRRALSEPQGPGAWGPAPGSEIKRVTLLPAQVEIALAAGDLTTARAAADELNGLVARFDSTATRAKAACALGAVQIAEGDAAGGAQTLRRAVQLWSEIDAPYEGARARMLLAEALAAQGAPEGAALEAHAARATFERLGAALDLRRADERLAALEEKAGAGQRPRAAAERAARAFVFTDIVDSTRLAELLGDEAWDTLIRWHDQALRSLVAEYQGEEIKATGDGFFLAFDDPGRAIECAIAIQRRLDEQRQAQGFAPAVRIGVHWAEANRAGLDYIGTGVNQAARIGSHAAGGEILVSAPTLARTRRTFAEVDRQTVTLKGIAAPVEVASIHWR